MHHALTKNQIALVQIHRALRCYRIHRDYVSAITLAGAAEEICGAELKRGKKSHALDERIWIFQSVETVLLGRSATDRKTLNPRLNRTRNELKHWNDSSIQSLDLDWRGEAEEMLDRAISNFFKLNGGHGSVEIAKFAADRLTKTTRWLVGCTGKKGITRKRASAV
jgi:hypothetical protein